MFVILLFIRRLLRTLSSSKATTVLRLLKSKGGCILTSQTKSYIFLLRLRSDLKTFRKINLNFYVFNMFSNLSGYRKCIKVSYFIPFDYFNEHINPLTVIDVKFSFNLFIRTHHKVFYVLIAPVFRHKTIIIRYAITIETDYGFISVACNLIVFNFIVVIINFFFIEIPVLVFVFMSSSSLLFDLLKRLKLFFKLADFSVFT